MSDAEPEEVSVEVERAGITVEKSFEPDDFPVPAIAFVIRSDRDEPTNVRIVDSVPDDVPTQDIGFHPKYGADFWDHEDDHIVFEREFGAGEEYTTVYGLRAKDTEDIGRFLSEPTVEGVGEEESVGDIIGDDEPAEESDEAAASDEPAAEADEDSGPTGPSLDLEEPGEADDEAADEPAADDGPEPRAEASADDLEAAVGAVDEDDEAAEADDPESDTDGTDGVGVAVDEVETEPADEGNGHEDVAVEAVTPDDLAATLAAEIRAGEVEEEDLETLRDALGAELDPDTVEVEADVPGSLEARLEKLQSDVTEVAAYTEALEAFLDESGGADELLAMHDEVESIRGSVEELEGTVSGLDDRVASVESTAEGAADRVAALESTVDDLDDGFDELHDEVSALQDDLAAMEADLGDDLDARVEEIETQLDDMEEDIETLENLRQALTGGN